MSPAISGGDCQEINIDVERCVYRMVLWSGLETVRKLDRLERRVHGPKTEQLPRNENDHFHEMQKLQTNNICKCVSTGQNRSHVGNSA